MKSFFLILAFLAAAPSGSIAATMTSSAYGIESDSMNFAGNHSTSTSYKTEDTAGEIGTGIMNGIRYIFRGGYQQTPNTAAAPGTDIIPTTSTGSGSGSSSGSTMIPVGIANPNNFVARPDVSRIILSWNLPVDPTLVLVRVVRSEIFFPLNINDGEIIYEGLDEMIVDYDVTEGRTYYYSIFARSSTGAYSSGALSSALVMPAVRGPITDPFSNIPPASVIPPAVLGLKLSDFEFIQSGKRIATAEDTLAIDGSENLTVRLSYDKVPEVLKTIAVTLVDPDDATKVFPFLLRVNDDKTWYEATIGPLGKSGKYGLSIAILDYKNQGLLKITGNLQALVFAVPQIIRDSGYAGIILIGLLALVLFIIWLLNRRRSKRQTIGPAMKGALSILLFIGLTSGSFAGFFAQTVFAAVNKEINYQGKLLNAASETVNDGSFNMRFRLYTAASGGSPIWTETWCYSPDNGSTCNGSGTDSRIAVTSGLLSIMLGRITSLTEIDFNQTLYLGVEIGTSAATPTWDGEMTPRKKIGAVPAAFVADTLDNLDSAQFLRSDAQNATSTSSLFLNILQSGSGKIAEFFGQGSASVLSVLSTGKVGIGTSTPYAQLSVEGSSVLGNSATAGYFVGTTTATSTLAGGINVASGCFAINGTCITGSGGVGAVDSVSNADGSLTISPTTGAVVASINRGNANTWTALQQFAVGASTTQLSAYGNLYVGGTATTTIVGNNGTSTFASFISATSASTTATSTMAGINLPYGGCVAVRGLCLTSNVGTVTSVDASGGTTGLSFTGGPITSSGTLTLGGILGVPNGGTGWAAINAGTILYGNGSANLATTTAGTAGNVLALLNGIPTWTSTTTFSGPLTYSSGNVSFSFATANTWTALQQFAAGASTTALSAYNGLFVGGTGTTTIYGTATSTFGAGVQSTYLNITGTSATSTFANGAIFTGGGLKLNTLPNCNAGSVLETDSNGVVTCGLDAGAAGVVTSVSNVDGSLTVSPTSGDVVASLNRGNSNLWTALQRFGAGASSTQISSFGNLYVGGTATTTIVGDNGTSTFSSFISTTAASTTATSTMAGINLPYGGCFAINGTCIGSGGAGTVTGSGANTRVAYWNGASSLTSDAGFTFNGTTLSVPFASTTAVSASDRFSVGRTSTTTILGDAATSTFGGGISLGAGNFNAPSGGNYLVNNALVLNSTILGPTVVTSSLNTVGALGSGSITSGFGSIDIGADALTAGAGSLSSLSVSGTSNFTGLVQMQSASSTAFSSYNGLFVGGTATTSIFGGATSTFRGGLYMNKPTDNTFGLSYFPDLYRLRIVAPWDNPNANDCPFQIEEDGGSAVLYKMCTGGFYSNAHLLPIDNPNGDDIYDIGSASLRWRDLFMSHQLINSSPLIEASSTFSGAVDIKRLGVIDGIYIGETATTTIFGNNATSSFAGRISAISASTTATSTTAGINIPYGGCFAVNGVCMTSNTGTVTGSGANTRIAFWNSASNLTSSSVFTFASNILTTPNLTLAGDGVITLGTAGTITDLGGAIDIAGTVQISGALTAATLNTGQGANELYDMNQNVQTTDTVTFLGASTTASSILNALYVGMTATTTIRGDNGTSTFSSFISATAASTTATSTMAGINLPYGGCFAIAGTCLSSGGSGSVNTGLSGYFAYYPSDGTTVDDQTTLRLSGSNIAIGTSTPYSKLSVWGSGTGSARLFELTNNSSTTLMAVLENGTAYFRGNLGVGTTSPYAALSIVGASGVVADKYHATSTTATSTFAGNVYISGTTVLDSVQLGNLSFDNDAGTVAWANLPISSSAPNNTVESYSALIDDLSVLTVYSQADGSGRAKNIAVGIGTSSPSHQLDILAGSTTPHTTGKTTNYYGVNVHNQATSSTASINKAGINISSTGTWNGAAANNIGLLVSSVTGGTNNYDAIFNGGGNVGIGTTSPYARLSVVGQVVAANFHATSTSATSTFAGGLAVGGGNLNYDFTTGITSISALQTGAFNFDDDAGKINWVDLNITSSAATNQVQSYAANIDGNPVLTVYSQADGSGRAKNLGVGIGTTTVTHQLEILAGSTTPHSTGMTASYSGIYVDNQATSSTASITKTGLTIRSTGSWSGSGASNIGLLIESVTGGTNNYDAIFNGGSNVGIGTTSPWRKLSVNGKAAFTGLTNDGTGYYVCLNNTTYDLATSSTACGASSERFKTNISTLTYGLNEVRLLNPVSFNWKTSFIATSSRQIGFIAEDVANIIPEVIGRDNKGQIMNLDYPKLTAVLVGAIKELDSKVASLASSTLAGTTTSSDNASDSDNSGGGILAALSAFFESVGVKFTSGLASFKKVAVETFTVGSKDKPTGLVLYDEEGTPYCLRLLKGGVISTAPVNDNGECEDLQNDDDDPVVITDDDTDDNDGQSATSTDPVGTNEDDPTPTPPVVSDEVATGSDAGSTPEASEEGSSTEEKTPESEPATEINVSEEPSAPEENESAPSEQAKPGSADEESGEEN